MVTARLVGNTIKLSPERGEGQVEVRPRDNAVGSWKFLGCIVRTAVTFSMFSRASSIVRVRRGIGSGTRSSIMYHE